MEPTTSQLKSFINFSIIYFQHSSTSASPKLLPAFLENRKHYPIPERRQIPAADLLISSYFTPADSWEGSRETYGSKADTSSGVHQHTERPTAWLQGRQVCEYSQSMIL
ncbi:hypothetical protein AVEN_1915-1 [Araneus ventricosus]|uniref:Uncharacterized protein n=1 Tax=Araneus ventricosus TaxID=182803 RepID=A0A4Y2KRC5_ARAVE|nr:hypothetical protein AVEN_1915-1 [Araneus ventricosus]